MPPIPDSFWENHRKRRDEKRQQEAASIPVSTKRKYVLGQGQTRRHHCHWPGCEESVPPAMWGCKRHWFKLPKHIRDRIWAAFNPGQEATMTPSDEYIEAAQEAQEWIEDYIKRHG